MFAASARFERGPVEFTVGMAFERRFWTSTIHRRGLTFDTRFSPAIDRQSDAVIVYLLLDGTLSWSSGPELHGPALFVMRQSDFEGSRARRTCAFRSWGTPFCSVELRIAHTDCAVSLDDAPSIVSLEGPSDPLVVAGRLYLHATHARARRDQALVDQAVAYLSRLHTRGVLASDLSTTITHDEGYRGRVWEALRPIIERFGAGAKLEDLATRIGGDDRRAGRELTRLAKLLGVGWLGGWRDVTVRYRVRVAALLLSSPALTVGEVGEAVGYGSVEALAHAFEACGLPSPTDVRRTVVGSFEQSGESVR